MSNEIKLKLTIDGREAIATLDIADENIRDMVASVKSADKSLSGMGDRVVENFEKARNAIQGVKEVFSVIQGAFGSQLTAYQEQERAMMSLTQAMKSAGIYTEEAYESLISYSTQLQQSTIYGDELTIQTMAQLTAMGLTTNQLKEATLQAANLASIMGTDLSGAVRVMGDLFAGDATMINRYIKGLDETILKSGDLDKILKMLNERIGGQAEALGNSGYGATVKFTNAIGDLQENAGELISNGIGPIVKLLSDLTNKVNSLSPSLSGIIGLTASGTAAFVTLRVTGILPAVSSIQLFGTALTGLRLAMIKTGIGALVVGLGYALSELAKAYDKVAEASARASAGQQQFRDYLATDAASKPKDQLEAEIKAAKDNQTRIQNEIDKLEIDREKALDKRKVKNKDGDEWYVNYETDASRILDERIKQSQSALENFKTIESEYSKALSDFDQRAKPPVVPPMQGKSETLAEKLAALDEELAAKSADSRGKELLELENWYKSKAELAGRDKSLMVRLQETYEKEKQQIEDKYSKETNQNEYDSSSKKLEIQKDYDLKLLELTGASRQAILNRELQYYTDKLSLQQRFGQETLETEQKIALARLDIGSEMYNSGIMDDSRKAEFQKELDDADQGYRAQYERLDAWREKEAAKYGADAETLTLIDAVHAQRREEIAAAEAEHKMDMAQQSIGMVAGLFGQQTAAYKLLAIAQATMDTYRGAAAALAPPPVGAGPLFGPILAAATIAAGLGNVAQIMSVETPKMTAYATGGMALVGETGPEIIAPAMDYAEGQAMLINAVINRIGEGGIGSDKRLLRKIDDLTDSINRWPDRVEFVQRRGDLYGVLQKETKFRERNR